MLDPGAPAVETPEDFGTAPAAVAARWIAELDQAEKALKPWRERCRRITRRYRAEDGGRGARRYAILWSNVQTLGPAVYARAPSAVVGRRHKTADPVGRLASEVLERAINFSLDAYDFSGVMRACRDEYLLFARGQAWVRYVPHFVPSSASSATGSSTPSSPSAGASTAGASAQVASIPGADEVVEWEEAIADYVPWEDFGHNPARNWSEVRFVYRRAFMDRRELKARFGPELGARVPLDWECEGAGEAQDETFRKAQVYEIWDRVAREAVWISRAFAQAPLDRRRDPLALRDFFPCPRPMYGTLGPDSLIPTPDYVYYQDQAEELDELTQRIDKLTEALKVTGFYSAAHKSDFAQLLAPSNENKLIPVESWAVMREQGGVRGLIEYWPVEQVIAVLEQCVKLRKAVIDDVWQITGVADVMRGQSDPDETAAAQGIKAHWGSLRVRDRQKEIERFARDLLRIVGEVIASKFSPETLGQMAGVQLLTAGQKAQIQMQIEAQGVIAQVTGRPPPPVPPQLAAQLAQPSWDEVMALLQNRATRMFRIDVESDSTILPDEQLEKQRRVEFVHAIGEFLGQSLPAVRATPQLFPVISESLKFLVRGFRAGREMEEVIERALDELQQASGEGDPGQPPGGEADRVKAEAAQLQGRAALMKAGTDQQRAAVQARAVELEHQAAMAAVAAENARTAAQAHVGLHDARLRHHADLHGALLQAARAGGPPGAAPPPGM